ncbi:DUF934 domain-containing protein [Mangrovitalea sediminis]|uniref:DUF934 domain-containing protein n=1 Tax=Mangrovitalea sediminis TaxID=1982043 RepID=UPI000BE57EFB|nr:DUF934 domain-containing protein [Mangrovitalea sediminis]
MSRLIKVDGLAADHWTRLEKPVDGKTVEVPEGNVIVPLSVWLAQRDRLEARDDIGVWFDSDEEPEALGIDCRRFPVIAVNFPKFTDGRGYSIGRLLRERYGFRHELRAVGDVLLDQLFYMKRCGFDAFVLREDKDINKAAKCLEFFSEAYQAAVDQTAPLFRRRERTVTEEAGEVAFA